MTNIAILTLPSSGHLNPIGALGRELQRRGHSVTVFYSPDMESQVQAEGLNFWSIGESDFPLGSAEKFQSQIGRLRGLSAIQFGVEAYQRWLDVLFREAPHAFREAGIEMLLVDQAEPAGGSIAEYLEIPFINICCALPSNREASIPPDFCLWEYKKSRWANLRNRLAYWTFDWLVRPSVLKINQQRLQWKLPAYRNPDDRFSQFAQISQLTSDFDFPRRTLPECFHYSGLFLRSSSAKTPPFPYERLNGLPLVYASLGTLLNRRQDIFHCIAAACEGLDVQLAISLGRGGSVGELQKLPGNPLVVEYVPQIELLAKAKLTITNAGLNTVLHSLYNGVPMVAIPISADQPGNAARLRWAGAGEVIPAKRLSVTNLRSAIEQVLTKPHYASSAMRLQESIRHSGGAARAADIVEQVIATGKTVFRNGL